MARAVYRSMQVFHALRPRLDAADLDFARGRLSEPEARLFFAMEKRDQRHALAVARRLRLDGTDDRDLLIAALLHDCGKGRVPVWLRILKVLHPGLLTRLADARGGGWRAAAYRLAEHAALGARLAEDAGASPTTVRLIAGRVAPDEASKQAQLQAADDAS